MLAVSHALGPLFLLILTGVLLRRLRFPGEHFWAEAERFIYFLLFPAMLISTLATADFSQVAFAGMVGLLAGMLSLFALGLWLNRHRLGADMPAFTSVFQGALRFNTYVGVAGAAALYGETGLTAAAVAIAIMVPLVNVLCVLIFVASGSYGQAGIWGAFRALARNPLLLACLAGIALNITGIGLPGWSQDTLALAGQAALPLGLIAVGVALQLSALRGTGFAFWQACAIKFGLFPMLAAAIGWAINLAPVELGVVVLFSALPTATSSYILARQMGGNAPLMAAIITGQTLLAMAILPLWMALLTLMS
ncbi:AEC family transporter [Oceanimonas sp. NS1]|uniref:Transporter n=1 Tax=Oceanimonas doudoroffii TaxID=84158 RepID=A0A233RAX3_9GAMM|nr:AEC family transporter [Oceanimonas doudoroffii]MCT7654504.1 AEC family transporter [Oceanimonas sp. NS1]OXY80523.1 transporter [Oceanimonas doudoroffii]